MEILSHGDDHFLNTTNDKRKKRRKSGISITNDGEVKDVNNSINDESFQKNKKVRDAKRSYTDLNENGIKVKEEPRNESTTKQINIGCPSNNISFEEPRRKKKKEKAELMSVTEDIIILGDGINSEYTPKKKIKNHLDAIESINAHNVLFTEELESTSTKKKKNIEQFNESPMSTERTINLPKKKTFHDNSSDSKDKKGLPSRYENHFKAYDQSQTAIKQESTKNKKNKNRESDIRILQASDSDSSRDFYESTKKISVDEKVNSEKKIIRTRNKTDKKNLTSQYENLVEADNQSVDEIQTTIKQESTQNKKNKDRESHIQIPQGSDSDSSRDFYESTKKISIDEKVKRKKKTERTRNLSTSGDTSNSAIQQQGSSETNIHKNKSMNGNKTYSSDCSSSNTDKEETNQNDMKKTSFDETSNNKRRHTIASSRKNQVTKNCVGKKNHKDDDSDLVQGSDNESINSENNKDQDEESVQSRDNDSVYNENIMYKKFSHVLEHFNTFKIDKQLFDRKLQINPSNHLFLLKCPKNLDISQLVGAKISTEGKSKLKIGNKKYECVVENNECQNRTILSPTEESGEYRLQSIETQGELRLRSKLPKPNVVNHIVAVKHNSFIPLPDTKRRHPLFGIEYKPMIKMNKHVAERLQEANTPASIRSPSPIKQRKKVKPEVVDLNISIKKNKKRKCKASDSESTSEVALKKMKQDPGKSQDIWSSEKHIAQNLFADF